MTTGIASDLSAFLLLVDGLTALAVVWVVFLPRRKATVHFAAAPCAAAHLEKIPWNK